MILFKPEHVDLILKGIKTETRRTWKKQRVKVGSIQKAKTKMLSKDYFAKLKILDVYLDKLGNMTVDDCYAEGGYMPDEYEDKFKEIYGFWKPELDVWVVKFKVEMED